MSEKSPSLLCTKDYSKFELCQFNRSVRKTKYLEQSMKQHGFIPAHPVHASKTASGRLQIKAGHHRFEVAQKLGLAIYYVISNDTASIHELEKATTTWTQKDYLESFVRCGYPAYTAIDEYHKRTGIPLGLCVAMLSGCAGGNGSHVARFKQGNVELTESGRVHAELVADMVGFCGRIGVKSTDTIFVQGISRCLFVSEFIPDVFKRRAESNVSMFRVVRLVAEQIELIESIYNRGAMLQNRVPLAFLVDAAMRTRNNH